jgi:protein-S-isoprenylcysteine O-methyltransferase Ste14
MFNSVFKIVYFIEYLLISFVRTAHTRQYRRMGVVTDKKTTLDLILLGVAGLMMLVPLLFVFSTVLDFANYRLPEWTGWIGAVVFMVAIWLLWRSHVDLGRNWTPTLGIREDHTLVTHGVFKHIRHPMYAAHLLWAIAQILMLHNWIAGFSLLAVTLPQYLLRFSSEEQMMLEQFGDAYKDYMKRTGRILPRLWG